MIDIGLSEVMLRLRCDTWKGKCQAGRSLKIGTYHQHMVSASSAAVTSTSKASTAQGEVPSRLPCGRASCVQTLLGSAHGFQVLCPGLYLIHWSYELQSSFCDSGRVTPHSEDTSGGARM